MDGYALNVGEVTHHGYHTVNVMIRTVNVMIRSKITIDDILVVIGIAVSLVGYVLIYSDEHVRLGIISIILGVVLIILFTK